MGWRKYIFFQKDFLRNLKRCWNIIFILISKCLINADMKNSKNPNIKIESDPEKKHIKEETYQDYNTMMNDDPEHPEIINDDTETEKKINEINKIKK
jgi:hypothetical protein